MFRSDLARQAIRYASSGGLLAAVYALVYALLAAHLGWPAQLANAAAFAINLGLGWQVHSRWSFRGMGYAGPGGAAIAGFAAINLLGYALNALWVFAVVTLAHRPALLAILPIVTATPAINFMLNRLLIFRVRH